VITDEQHQRNLAEAIRIVRMRHLLTTVLPFVGEVLVVDCPAHLVRWVAERTGWVVAIEGPRHGSRRQDYELEKLENVDLFRGTLAEYEESPDAWDWRLGFGLAVVDGTPGQVEDPAQELKRLRGWASWILATAEAGDERFRDSFSEVIVCEDDGEWVIILGR